jgi:hypothetical protein
MGVCKLSIQRVVIIAGAMALSACEAKTKHISDLPDPLPSPGFQPPVTRAEQNRADLSKEAQDLQAAFDEMNSKGSGTRDGAAESPSADPAPSSRGQGRGGDRWGEESRKASKEPAGPLANQPASVPEAAKPADSRARKGDGTERTLAQKRQDAIAELSSQLKPGIDGAKEPLRAAMPLLGLDAISSGAAVGHLELVFRAVTPDQRRTVEAARDLMRSFATDPNLTSGDPGAMARLLREEADQLSGTAPQDGLALGTVALCQRVDGFGRFATLGTNSFVAGRPNAMIVYSEIENFSQTRGTDAVGPVKAGVEQWRVELGQTVHLYLESDGSEQLVLPESVVRDASTSKRRDFFLVQRVDLPRNLSVGNYNLKIAVRDVASGAIAERSIPIRVVADSSAIRESASRAGVEAVGKPGGPGQFAGSGK